MSRKEATLTELREKRKLLRSRLVLARDKQLLEALSTYDDFGGSDLLDRIRPSTNEDGELWIASPPNTPSDRRGGANWPLWRNQQELDRFRQESRIRCDSNSYAKGLLKNLTNNVIGKGCSYKVVPVRADGDDLTPEQDADVDAAQKVVDNFLKRNNWNGGIDPHGNLAVVGSREREIYRTQTIDGDVFLRFHRQPDGATIVRFIDASQVRDGGAFDRADGWTYGVQHQMHPFEDVETPLNYAVFWQDPTAKGGAGESEADRGNWEIVPAEEVLHLKGPDTPSNVKRGLPAFIFDAGRALDRAARLQENSSIADAIRAAVAETWQYEGMTAAQAGNMAAALADATRSNPRTGKTETIERVKPGTVRRGPTGGTLVPPSPSNTQAYMAGVQGDLQQASAGFCAPTFWLGDTANANYSNLESASAPAVRAGQCEQEYFKTAFARCVWKAISWAEECGKLPVGATDRVTIQVEAPAVLHRNELERSQTDQIDVQGGWKDRQTCAAERGLDWDLVQANNQEYQELTGGQGPGLPMPGDDDEDGSGEADKPRGAGQKPAGAATTEARLERMEAGLVRLLEWAEDKVHRGQPGNAGQFGPGGAGAKTGADKAKSDAPAGAKAKTLFSPAQREKAKARKTKREARKVAAKAVISNVTSAADEAFSTTAVTGAVKKAARAVGKHLWDSLDSDQQRQLTKVGHVAMAVDHAIERYTLHAGQSLAIECAKERGLGLKQQNQVAAVTKTVDTIAQWTTNIPIVHAGIEATELLSGGAAFLAAKVGYYVPVGSLAYIGYSTARNPMATIRAAKNTLKAWWTSKPKAHGDHPIHESQDDAGQSAYTKADVDALCEGLNTAGDETDWYMALVSAALDQTDDLGEAVEGANAAFAKQRSNPDPDSDDYDDVLEDAA